MIPNTASILCRTNAVSDLQCDVKMRIRITVDGFASSPKVGVLRQMHSIFLYFFRRPEEPQPAHLQQVGKVRYNHALVL